MEKTMERDENFSDRTSSKERKSIPQADQSSRGAEPSTSVEDADATQVAKNTKEGMKDASGKLPRGEV
jgi:hypothetical protein